MRGLAADKPPFVARRAPARPGPVPHRGVPAGQPPGAQSARRRDTGGQDVTGNALERLTAHTRGLAEICTARDAWDLARTAEAARRYAQMKGLGHEAVNYATGIKAKAMLLLAEFVDIGQAAGTVRTRNDGKSKGIDAGNTLALRDVLGATNDQQAAQAVYQARSLRAVLDGADVDELIAEANESAEDLGIRGLRILATRRRQPEPVHEPIPLPDGKFSCIVADPPWAMRLIERAQRPDQGRHVAYPTMELDEIAKLPVAEMAADNSHLYLWVTHRFLPAGLDIAGKWGFDYQCLLTWRKNVGFTPFSWMYDTEHVIFARRGNLKLTELGLRLSFDAPVAGHSVKPDVFYERVLAASPGPRLEMFARRERDGFTAWGNEVADAV